MTDEPTPVIETEGLSVGYGERVVQRGLDLRIARGEIFVLLGGSGCGKSTVLRTLIGLVPPLAGRVRILGRVFAEAGREPDEDPAILRHIGVMFQNGALFGSKTLLENCALPQETLTDRAPEEIERISRDRLRDVGLLDFADFLPKEISGGMQKRAAIARALSPRPASIRSRRPNSTSSSCASGPRRGRPSSSSRTSWRRSSRSPTAPCSSTAPPIPSSTKAPPPSSATTAPTRPCGPSSTARPNESPPAMRKSSYVKIGAFVCAAVLLAVVAVVLMGSGPMHKRELLFETFVEETVQGVSEGSAVKYRGIPVGSVKSISFATYDYTDEDVRPDASAEDVDRASRYARIVLAVDTTDMPDPEEFQRFVERETAKGLRAHMKSQGITGLVYVDCDYEDPGSPTLPVPWNPKHPYIPMAPSLSKTLTDAVQGVAQEIRGFADVRANVTSSSFVKTGMEIIFSNFAANVGLSFRKARMAVFSSSMITIIQSVRNSIA